jgi:ATP-dependent Clp protease ATP-binding subunit ClpC
MPAESFHLKCLSCVLAEDVELSEALGLPEVSALEDPTRPGRPILAAKAKSLLEDMNLAPAVTLHRRRITAEVETDSLVVEFKPPRRNAEWETPVLVTIHFVRWSEGGRHQAYVPALGAHVFAARASQVRQHVEEHIRLLLASSGQPLKLHRLERLARIQSLRLEELDVLVQRRSPRQVVAAGSTASDKPSALTQLAEELPPCLTSGEEPVRRNSRPSGPSMDQAHELDEELLNLAEALSAPNRRSLLLVGPPGTGKTALVRELARRRAELGFPHTAFWTTSAARLMSGPVGFGMWQERCQNLCREAARTKAILHLGNLSELTEVGKVNRDGQSVGGFLRPWLARGEVFAMAEVTPEQLAAIGRTEPNLLTAFQTWPLKERTPEQTRRILEAALAAAPGKSTLPESETQTALERLHQVHTRYATYSANPGRPLRFLRNLLADRFPEKSLTEASVLAAFSRETGLPAVLLDDDTPLDLAQTREWFSERVIGQPAAVDRVLDLLAMVKARLARPRKPLASFLFIGPTGTGKTEMAKATAEFLFGDPARMVRFDLNEFSDPIAVQRLIGGPAAGGNEGLLTARVREQPFSVILLDEFEKADPSFFDLLLQILGDGRLTDAAGRVADFCNSVVIMTSNLGAQGFHTGPVGFRTTDSRRSDAGTHFADAVRRFLRPEIFNRMDAIVPFLPLEPDVVLRIAHRHLEEIRKRDGLRYRPIDLVIEPEVARELAAEGYDVRYGARPLRRSIARTLLVPLAEALNGYPKDTPLRAEIRWQQGRPAIHVRSLLAVPRNRKNPNVPNPPEPTSEAQLAAGITGFRRSVGRIASSGAATRVDDEISLLEAAERRLVARKGFDPEIRARLERLRSASCAAVLLEERSRELEVDVLLPLYERRPLDMPVLQTRLSQLTTNRRQVLHDLFRAHLPAPDQITLGFFAEPRELLGKVARAFHSLALRLGTVDAMEFIIGKPIGRRGRLLLERQRQDNPCVWPNELPTSVWGVAFDVRGDLCFPRFSGEQGLHIFRQGRSDEVVWIQTTQKGLAEISIPGRLEQAGHIKNVGGEIRRTHLVTQEVIRDAHLGERPCSANGWEAALPNLIEERLERIIEAATGGGNP